MAFKYVQLCSQCADVVFELPNKIPFSAAVLHVCFRLYTSTYWY